MKPTSRKIIFGIALAAAVAVSLPALAKPSGNPLPAVKEANPAACVVSEQTGMPCQNWNMIPEKPNPDACIYELKQTGKQCMRWYSIYSKAKRQEVVLSTTEIHFEFDKSRILPSSYPVLDRIAQTISRPEVENVVIEGHTDSVGSDEYNLRLSDRRAAAVREYMMSHGVSDSEMSSVGKGESEPVADNTINGRDNPSGRDQNRRVEFHLQLSPNADAKVVAGEAGPVFPDKNRDLRSASR
jgi:outer membrane protein OmpA-like peptidoglycan-associated protein